MRLGLPALSLLVVAAAQGCAPQVKDKGKVTITNLASATMPAEGGQVGISDGSNVAMPAGAVALGTNVTMQKVAQPAEFAATGNPAAGAPMVLKATGPDGAELQTAASPMTVSLAVGASSTLALAGASTDNLCVLLKATAGGLYVWRRSAITYSDATKLAQIQTIAFGTFQLVYCGQDPAPGFSDALLSNMSGGKQLPVALTLPAGFDSDLSPGKSCLLVLSDTPPAAAGAKEAVKVLAVKEDAYQAGADVPLTLTLPATALVTGPTYLVALALVDAAGACPFKVGDDLGDSAARAGLLSFYAFDVTADQLTAGVAGKLGADAPYKTGAVTLALGGPTPLDSFVRPDVPDVCLAADTDFGHVQRRVSFANGEIGKGASFALSVPLAQATTAKLKIDVRVGQDCTSFDDAPGQPLQGLPYRVSLVKANAQAGASFFLTPVTLHVTSSNPVTAALNGCLLVATPGAFAAGNAPIGQLDLSLSGGTYQLYLPYLSDPAMQSKGLPQYDMQITVLDQAGSCRDPKTSLPPVLLKSKTLSSDIDVAL